MPYEYKHGNFMVGAPDNSLFHDNIMKSNVAPGECKGCSGQGLQAYYSRASGSTCPCTGEKVAYTNYFSHGH